MSKQIKSIKGLLSQTIHYRDGAKVGESWPGLFGKSLNHYDANGKYIGYSDPGFVTDMIHYDECGRCTGETRSGLFGDKKHFDADRNYIGETWNGLAGSTTVFIEMDDFDDADCNDVCDGDEW